MDFTRQCGCSIWRSSHDETTRRRNAQTVSRRALLGSALGADARRSQRAERRVSPRLWQHGGREYVMRFPDHWKPGFRPWAWWIADYPDELKRKAERAKNPPDVMTLLHWSGDARPGEREAWLIWRRDELERECKWLEYLEAKLVKPENAGKRATRRRERSHGSRNDRDGDLRIRIMGASRAISGGSS